MSKANQKFVQADEAVSPVIGVILMVAITVVLAAVVFVLVSNLGEGSEAAPQVTLTKNGAGDSAVLTVQNAPVNLDWADFTASMDNAGCTANIPSTGSVSAGNTIDFTAATAGDCIGAEFSLIHTATNSVSARATL